MRKSPTSITSGIISYPSSSVTSAVVGVGATKTLVIIVVGPLICRNQRLPILATAGRYFGSRDFMKSASLALLSATWAPHKVICSCFSLALVWQLPSVQTNVLQQYRSWGGHQSLFRPRNFHFMVRQHPQAFCTLTSSNLSANVTLMYTSQ